MHPAPTPEPRAVSRGGVFRAAAVAGAGVTGALPMLAAAAQPPRQTRGPGRTRIAALAALTLSLLVVPAARSAADPTPGADPGHPIVVDAQDSGRRFDGVGGVSAGGSSRLLFDYPPAQREQILDYLFAPNHGAALDILKVEIGGDVDATVGAEPSHQRRRDTVECDRGHEWRLMREAQRRNPEIAFYGVMWGAPGWLNGGIWSKDHVDYLMSWLGCAKQNGFQIDYLGGANESGYDRDFYITLADALDTNGFSHIKVVATDDHKPPDYYSAATDMADDPEFGNAVDILGEHDVCVWRTQQKSCHANQDALDSGKPLWDSENSTQDYDVGAGPLARAMNRHYIDARVTGNLNWGLLSAWYGSFPIGGTGLMLADRPWSGWYDVGPEIWVDAHTTQFTEPGWRYVNGASGYSDGGASYVAMRSPDTGDYTVVVETMDLKAPETLHFQIQGDLSSASLSHWSTNLATTTGTDDFQRDAAIKPSDGQFSARVRPGHVYTFSTTRGQSKGDAHPTASAGEQLPIPYREDFEVGPGGLARYVSDVHGGFQAEPCAGSRGGLCYQQMLTQAPISWHGTTLPPTTIVGDPTWWGDYEVTADALLDQPGHVELLGRVESQQHRAAGYHLRVSDTGEWKLITEDGAGKNTTLASGSATPLGLDSWHRLGMRFRADRITVLLDGEELATVRDDSHTSGQVGLRVGGWQQAQFDNVAVTPTAPAPRFLSHDPMSVTATSEHTENDFGHTYPARRAIDDRVESAWRSAFAPAEPLPQSITLDLGSERTVRGLAYKPMVTGAAGAITGFEVSTSRDGEHFTPAASGWWEPTVATKTVALPATTARHIRLTARDSVGCPKAGMAAEINVSTSTLADLGHGEPPPDSPPGFDHLVPQGDITASASSHQPGYEASQAIDGNCGTMWHTSWSPHQPPPQSVTLDLGRDYRTVGLVYQPRQDGNPNGVVTGYRVQVSQDGQTFTEVATGSWPVDGATKTATWPVADARHVRLTAVTGSGGYASAAELNVGFDPG